MKHIVYIGNKFNSSVKSNVSTIDVLSKLLVNEGYSLVSASNKKNIVFRLLDMLWVVFKNRKTADYVLIDTYSTLNFYYAFFVSQLCRLLNLKYIPILHGGNLPNRLKNAPKLSKLIFNKSYLNIAPSGYIENHFKAHGVNNITCVPNSLELDQYPFNARVCKSIKLLWVRSFSKIYNPKLAVDVLKALQQKGFEAELCMVGPDTDGSLREVKQNAIQQGVKVTFTGQLSKKEWLKLSEKYNIFINTTNFDNMPVSVIEAMALGLPVVSTNVGGLPFLIKQNKTGILVEPNSVKAFVFAIESLINDPDFALELSLSARKYVENFSWNVVKTQWLNILQ